MSEHFIGEPALDLGGIQPYKVVTSDLMPSREQVMGITLPHNMIAGTNWVQLPTADGASTVHMNSYGQWQNGGGAPAVGDWVEWNFGGVKTFNGVHVWTHFWLGPNLGKFQVSWNGTNVGNPIDCYAAGYTSGVSAYVLLEGAGTAVIPRKNTMRWTIVTKNASSSANYILLNSICVYGAE